MRKKVEYSDNPTQGYQRSWWSTFNSYWYGNHSGTWFNFQEVPIMKVYPVIRFALNYSSSPYTQIKLCGGKGPDGAYRPLNVRNRPDATAFLQRTFQKFWYALPALLRDKYCWGRFAAGLEFGWNKRERIIEIERVRRIEPNDTDPRMFADGRRKGDPAGFELRSQTHGTRFVSLTHGLYYAGAEEVMPFVDTPLLMAAHTPWKEANAIGGARSSRRLAAWRRGVGGMEVRYPDGAKVPSPTGDGTWIKPQDAARQIGERIMNGYVLALPGTKKDGDYLWKVDQLPTPGNGTEIETMGKYIDSLHDEMYLGMDIPFEIFHTDGTGAYNGRSIPMESWFVRHDAQACDVWVMFRTQHVDPLMKRNYGIDSYDAELTSLLADFRQQNGAGPSGPGGGPGTPYIGPRGGHGVYGPDGRPRYQHEPPPQGQPGAAPVNLSTIDAGSVNRHQLHKAIALAMIEAKLREHGGQLDPDRAGDLIHWLPHMAHDHDEARRAFGLRPAANLSMYTDWEARGTTADGRTRWYSQTAREYRYQKSKPGEWAERRKTLNGIGEKGIEIIKRVAYDQHQPEELHQLPAHIHAMTVPQLRRARTFLKASFLNQRTRAGMTSALTGHVQGLIDNVGHTPEAEPAPAPRRLLGAAAAAAKRNNGTPAAPKLEHVYTVPTASLVRKPELMQYKVSGINAKTGTGSELKGVKKWSHEAAGVLLAWRDPETGEDIVVNGHHRHELAEGLNVPTLNVRYIDAPNAQLARAVGALANIREGRGSPTDAAKFMRDAGITPDEMADNGVSLSGPVMAKATALRGLSDKAFKALTAGRLDEDTAVAVGKHVSNHQDQDRLFSLIDRDEENGKPWGRPKIEAAASKMAKAARVSHTENTLFGDIESEDSTWADEAELEAHIGGRLRQKANDFGAVSSERRAGEVAGAGNVLNIDENQKRKVKAEGMAEDFDRQRHLVGPVSQIIQRHAKELHNAKPSDKPAIKQRAHDDIVAHYDGGPKGPAVEAVEEPAGRRSEPAKPAAPAGMTKAQAKEIVAGMDEPSHLPENHGDYFNVDKADKTVPIDKINALRARPDGIANAAKFMEGSRRGVLPKRDPIKVVEHPDGTYTVADGNSTFANAQKHKWSSVPVKLVSQEWLDNEQAHTTKKEYAKIRQKITSAVGDGGDLPKKWAMQLPIKSYADIRAHAEAVKPVYDAIIDHGGGVQAALGARRSMADTEEGWLKELEQPGPIVRLAPIKGEKRSVEKVNADFAGNWGLLKDMVRGTVAVDTAAEVPKAIEALKAELAKNGWELAQKPKNKFATPTLEGYADVNYIIKTPQGFGAEVQVHLKQMLVAKEEAHKLYEKSRTVAADIKMGGGIATPEQAAAFGELVKQQRGIYGAAWLKAMGLPAEHQKHLDPLLDAWHETHHADWAKDLAEIGLNEEKGVFDVSKHDDPSLLRVERPTVGNTQPTTPAEGVEPADAGVGSTGGPAGIPAGSGPDNAGTVPFNNQSSAQSGGVNDHQSHVNLARAIEDHFNAGGTIDSNKLAELANHHFGGTKAEGAYGPSDAYDALENGFQSSLRGKTNPGTQDLADAQQQARDIKAQVDALPTQTNRSGNKDDLQQFSTPPHYAFAAAWLLNPRKGETVLEPSAGTGSLAVHAENAGAKIIANEIDPRRAAYLKHLFGDQNVHIEDAEHISGILPARGVQPTAVLMNPPFSNSPTGLKDQKVATRHIEEGLKMLPEGGRLVAIVGRGMSPESKSFAEWFHKMGQQYAYRANVGVSGNEYKKYGTSFGTRVIVFDKVPPGGQSSPITGDANDVPDLMQRLQGVRNDRPEPALATSRDEGGRDVSERPGGVGPAGSGPGVGMAGGRPEITTPEGMGGGRGPALASDESGRSTGVPDGRLGDAEPRVEYEPATRGNADPGEPSGQPDPAPGRGGKSRKRGKDSGQQPVPEPANRVSELRAPVAARGVTKSTKPAAGSPAPKPKDDDGTVSKAEAPTPEGDGLAKAVAASSATKTQSQLTANLYEPYVAQSAVFEGSKPNVSPLVESAAMAAVTAPQVAYAPVLSPDVIQKKVVTLRRPDGSTYETDLGLSDAGLETVAKAGQQHQKFFVGDDGIEYRHGFMCGDGTGAAKGRQGAGIIADNWNQGRKKAVWLTLKQNLFGPSQADWREVGMPDGQLFHSDDLREGKAPAEGVCFMTYSTLRAKPTKGNADQRTNLEKLAEWLGPDFDGCINFDEAHAMGNSGDEESEASQQALAGIKLQKMFPKARVTYLSATGATEISNFGYLDRLGLWGQGKPWKTKSEFMNSFASKSTAALEQVAQSLKATGQYHSRSLAMSDGTDLGSVQYEKVTHKLTPEQHYTWNKCCEGWQAVLQNIERAIDSGGGSKSRAAKNAARSQLWGAQQRFFNQIITSFKVPTLIDSIKADLAAGRSPVIQLVNTQEAGLTKALSDRDETPLEELDVSPHEILMSYLEKSFPTEKWREVPNASGNGTTWEVVKDSKGNVVHDPGAVAIRDELKRQAEGLRAVIPDGAIDRILKEFGHDTVAEVSGRKKRIVWQPKPGDPTKMEAVLQSRSSKSVNVDEAGAFQDGRKKILLFTDAGGTGSSYHADKRVANQGRRSHYVLQPGWRADTCVQGLGRTHRTNQSSAPIFKIIDVPEIPSARRFTSTIARRLDTMGALTKGERRTGGGGMFEAADNLETTEAKDALEKLWKGLTSGMYEGFPRKETMQELGYYSEDPKTGKPKNVECPAISQFLNRTLSMSIDRQQALFKLFDQIHNDIVQERTIAGTLDRGTEDWKADRMEVKDKQELWRDPDTGANVHLITTLAHRKNFRIPWAKRTRWDGVDPNSYVRDKQTGEVWGVWTEPETHAGERGERATIKMINPTGVEKTTDTSIGTDGEHEQFELINEDEARRGWQEHYDSIPATRVSEERFVSGATLPVWHKITASDKLWRVAGDGQTFVGRHVGEKNLDTLLRNFGMAVDVPKYSHEQIHAKLRDRTVDSVELSNGMTLKPVRFQKENAIEIKSPGGYGFSPYVEQNLKQLGAIAVRQAYKWRFFVPTSGKGVDILKKVMEGENVTRVNGDDAPLKIVKAPTPEAQ